MSSNFPSKQTRKLPNSKGRKSSRLFWLSLRFLEMALNQVVIRDYISARRKHWLFKLARFPLLYKSLTFKTHAYKVRAAADWCQWLANKLSRLMLVDLLRNVWASLFAMIFVQPQDSNGFVFSWTDRLLECLFWAWALVPIWHTCMHAKCSSYHLLFL